MFDNFTKNELIEMISESNAHEAALMVKYQNLQDSISDVVEVKVVSTDDIISCLG